MKRTTIRYILTSIALCFCLGLVTQAPLRDINTPFIMNDKKYDDFGAGNITYPKSINKEGVLDINSFKVSNKKDTIEFQYTMRSIDNEYDSENGFSHLLIDTYISVDDKGLLSTIEYGSAISFDEENPWKYHIRITPEDYYIEKLVDINNRKTKKLKDVSLEIKGNKIKLSLPQSSLQENLKKAKYYVFTGGFDVFGPDNYRRVLDEGENWYFSGGIKSLYQPNVIDVVSPIQKEMLVYFMPPQYSVLTPVFNQLHQRIFTKEILYITILIIFSLKYRSIYKKGIKRD